MKAQEIVDLDGAGRKLAAHGAQFGHLVDSYVNSVNTCFNHMGVSVIIQFSYYLLMAII